MIYVLREQNPFSHKVSQSRETDGYAKQDTGYDLTPPPFYHRPWRRAEIGKGGYNDSRRRELPWEISSTSGEGSCEAVNSPKTSLRTDTQLPIPRRELRRQMKIKEEVGMDWMDDGSLGREEWFQTENICSSFCNAFVLQCSDGNSYQICLVFIT